jgi:hypothetical protein
VAFLFGRERGTHDARTIRIERRLDQDEYDRLVEDWNQSGCDERILRASRCLDLGHLLVRCPVLGRQRARQGLRALLPLLVQAGATIDHQANASRQSREETQHMTREEEDQRADQEQEQEDGKDGKKPVRPVEGKPGFQPIESQDDLDQIIRRRLNGMRKKLTEEIREEIEADIESKAAEEQGEYKKLYDELQVKHRELESRLAERDLIDRKRDVAKRVGLPDARVDRIKGETEEEMEADAKAMAALVKTPAEEEPETPEAPDTDSGRKTPPRASERAESFLDSYEFGKRRR